MSPRQRIQTEVSKTDDQGGLAQRMSLRRKVKMDEPAVLAFLSQTSTVSLDGCLRDEGSRHMSPRPRIQTDVALDGGSRRMSLRRRIQTEVCETDDQGRLAQRMSLRRNVKMGGPPHLGFPSQGHPCVPSALALRFRDGCHRRMFLRRMTETEGHDGCHRQMSPRRR